MFYELGCGIREAGSRGATEQRQGKDNMSKTNMKTVAAKINWDKVVRECTWKAHAKKTPIEIKSVKVEAANIWNGDLPKKSDTYQRKKAVITSVAYPLIAFAHYSKRKDGRVVVSFPVEIVVPRDFTKEEVKSAVANLGTF